VAAQKVHRRVDRAEQDQPDVGGEPAEHRAVGGPVEPGAAAAVEEADEQGEEPAGDGAVQQAVAHQPRGAGLGDADGGKLGERRPHAQRADSRAEKQDGDPGGERRPVQRAERVPDRQEGEHSEPRHPQNQARRGVKSQVFSRRESQDEGGEGDEQRGGQRQARGAGQAPQSGPDPAFAGEELFDIAIVHGLAVLR